ncbi:MAG: glycosyltransferase [Opitutales bacterium]|nr:glycosyltransferase [Opitutales bacterium]
MGGGGANQIAWNLSNSFQKQGHVTKIITRESNFSSDIIHLINNNQYRNRSFRFFRKLTQISLKKNYSLLPNIFHLLSKVSEPIRLFRNARGREDFDFPGTRHLSKIAGFEPDLIHAHNLHSDFFDLRKLPYYSNKIPFFLTLHDCWSFTGHCCHFFDCERWKKNCGKCPHLDIPINLKKDGTRSNLTLKRKLYSTSKIHVATPSKWLANHVSQSILSPAIRSITVIPNGVDQSIFTAAEKIEARKKLNVPETDFIISFSCSSPSKNPWKNYGLIGDIVRILAKSRKHKNITFLIMGEDGESTSFNHIRLKKLGWLQDRREVAVVYQASDLYLHPTNADTYPNVILEAMSCGTPVFASNVGGIPEQITDQVDGRILPNHPETFASAIKEIIFDDQKLNNLAKQSLCKARKLFNESDMIKRYNDWYQQGISDFTRN